jgi:hypothetical protein
MRGGGRRSGARGDAFTAAIAHRESGNDGVERVMQDAVYIRQPPFNPSVVIEEIAQLLKNYRITEVTGDNYSAEFCVEAFRKVGIRYKTTKLNRSEIYVNFAPLVMAGMVSLLDDPMAIVQFASLERRPMPAGRDRIDHPINGHDDLSNAIAGVVVLASYDREQVVPIVAPIVIYKDGSSTLDHMLARRDAGAKDPEAARAARERAMQPLLPHPQRDPNKPLTSTELFYMNGGGGGTWWGSI